MRRSGKLQEAQGRLLSRSMMWGVWPVACAAAVGLCGACMPCAMCVCAGIGLAVSIPVVVLW